MGRHVKPKLVPDQTRSLLCAAFLESPECFCTFSFMTGGFRSDVIVVCGLKLLLMCCLCFLKSLLALAVSERSKGCIELIPELLNGWTNGWKASLVLAMPV